jgi:hypothetical protein
MIYLSLIFILMLTYESTGNETVPPDNSADKTKRPIRRKRLTFAQEVRAMVRGGFESRARIIEIFAEERYAPGEIDRSTIEKTVDDEYEKLIE